MKTQNLFAIAMAMTTGIALTACGGAKSLHSASSEVTVPLSGPEYRSNKEYFRAKGIGKSPDLSTAEKIALQEAKQQLGGLVKTETKVVTGNYTKQRSQQGENKDAQELGKDFDEMAISVVDEELNDVRIIGEKVFKENGKFTYHIAIEMSKTAVVDGIANRISKDAKLQLEFDKQQFQRVFDDEMAKLEAKNNNR